MRQHVRPLLCESADNLLVGEAGRRIAAKPPQNLAAVKRVPVVRDRRARIFPGGDLDFRHGVIRFSGWGIAICGDGKESASSDIRKFEKFDG